MTDDGRCEAHGSGHRAHLSYVVVTDCWESIADVVRSLEAQSAATAVELVVVAPPAVPIDGAAPRLAGVIVLRREDGGGPARAAAVSAATGEVIVLGETHVLLGPAWAAAVLGAVEDGADVVLPLMASANVGALAWAAFVMDYGRYAAPGDGSDDVPIFNAAFRRAALLELPALDELLVPGRALDAALRSRGARVVQIDDPAAITRHLNVSRPRAWLHERLLAGVLLAADRSRGWGALRRAAFVAATPAIAAVLIRRKAPACRTVGGRRTLPALALACVLQALGEAAGYAGLGRESQRQAMARYETRKREYLAG